LQNCPAKEIFELSSSQSDEVNKSFGYTKIHRLQLMNVSIRTLTMIKQDNSR